VIQTKKDNHRTDLIYCDSYIYYILIINIL